MGMKFSKKLSKSGSITLPAALRREYGLSDGDKFKISVNLSDGSILLQPTNPECMFCGSVSQTIVYVGRNICHECVEEMQDKFKEMETLQ